MSEKVSTREFDIIKEKLKCLLLNLISHIKVTVALPANQFSIDARRERGLSLGRIFQTASSFFVVLDETEKEDFFSSLSFDLNSDEILFLQSFFADEEFRRPFLVDSGIVNPVLD